MLDPKRVADFREALTPWALSARRDLPWRRTRDPWAVLVSEVMLQQTQVARVIPKWADFLMAFPTVESCARAPQSSVVRLWEGLGYHRRAVSLHRAAQAVVSEFDGVFPRTLTELQRLPGIGPYTARAVLAFAFECDAAVVDTNVGRILARAVIGRKCSSSEAQSIADSLAPKAESWSWNQGLLDLGATVCTKQDPHCDACPLRSLCTWRSGGFGSADPAIGSAGVSGGQSRFAGSDRQGRGRLLAALRNGPVPIVDVMSVMGWPDDAERTNRVAQSLVLDGLARRGDQGYELS